MLYYTQIIFIKKDKATVFNDFEDHVLPLLERHNGKLLYRVRPAQDSVIETTLGYPYEIHLVSFQDKKGFESYRDDQERLQHMPLKDSSVDKVIEIMKKSR